MKKCIALVVSISFIGAALTSPAYGAVKAGAACTKAGSTSVASGKKYTCIKSGKKLAWNKGVQEIENQGEDILLSPIYTELKISVLKTSQNNYSWVPSPGILNNRINGCNLNGHFLYGKVAFTRDLKQATFKVFNSYYLEQSDLGVVVVSQGGATSCGKWQLVESWGNPDLYLALVSIPQAADFVFYNGY